MRLADRRCAMDADQDHSASQPSTIGTEKRRMNRVIIGCAPTCVLLCADFTSRIRALRPSVVFSSFTTPSTVICS